MPGSCSVEALEDDHKLRGLGGLGLGEEGCWALAIFCNVFDGGFDVDRVGDIAQVATIP